MTLCQCMRAWPIWQAPCSANRHQTPTFSIHVPGCCAYILFTSDASVQGSGFRASFDSGITAHALSASSFAEPRHPDSLNVSEPASAQSGTDMLLTHGAPFGGLTALTALAVLTVWMKRGKNPARVGRPESRQHEFPCQSPELQPVSEIDGSSDDTEGRAPLQRVLIRESSSQLRQRKALKTGDLAVETPAAEEKAAIQPYVDATKQIPDYEDDGLGMPAELKAEAEACQADQPGWIVRKAWM